MEESIYNIITEDPLPPKRQKKYRSQFPGTIQPSYSTFANHSNIIQVKNISGDYQLSSYRYASESGIIGKSKTQQLSPIKPRIMGTNNLDEWIEKGSVVRSQEFAHSHRNKLKPLVPRSIEKPTMGLQSNRNFIATNKIDVILKSPRQQQEDTNWLTKKDYGQIPLYLSQIKDQLQQSYLEEQNYAKQQLEAQNDKLQLLQEEELQQIREGLKQRYDEVNKQYQQYTHLKKFDTVGLKRRKEQFEKELIQLEKDMDKMKKQYVFVEK
ncbi:unnamed protein product [Paramecium primaurelia]|uniref:Enkurin domain-containing protein n=1 Tax=Paramecium primaurelia TaxID=5886 RepID=A0A8S1LTK7_PARPR|nr:unnamed protein product [Paramecium primaurelia]